MYVIVAGCGRVGSHLAQALSMERHDVVVIDNDPSAFRRLGGVFNGVTLEGVAFDEDVLVQAGIEQADAYAAVTNHDNTNLMASEVARNVFGVPAVQLRLFNPDKELTCFKLGMDYVCGTTMVTEVIRERLFQSEHAIVQLDRIGIGMQIVEFNISQANAGRAVGQLDHPPISLVISVVRDNKEMALSPTVTVEPGDRVVLTLTREGWGHVARQLGLTSIPGARSADSANTAKPEAEQTQGHPQVIIAGCSMVGSHLAYMFDIEEYNVTVIDEDPTKFDRLPASFKGRTIEGVTFDEETLLEAGIEHADALVAVTKFDNKNLMAAEVARHVFRVPHVMGRLFNTDKEETYRALGMRYVCGTRMVAQVMLERMLKPNVAVLGNCVFNKFDLVEFSCPRRWYGKTVGQVRKQHGLGFACIARESTGYLPEDDFVLTRSDIIIALATGGRRQRLETLLHKDLRGEGNSYRH